MQTVNKVDKLVPHFVQDVVGHITGMPGLFISCVFSASLSTVSANLNSFAGVIYLDFIKPLKSYRHTERRANFIMKTIIVLLGIECAMGALVVEKFESIFQMMNTVAGTSTGAIIGVFTVGMLYPWANKHVSHNILSSSSSLVSVMCLGLHHKLKSNMYIAGCSLWCDNQANTHRSYLSIFYYERLSRFGQ